MGHRLRWGIEHLYDANIKKLFLADVNWDLQLVKVCMATETEAKGRMLLKICFKLHLQKFAECMGLATINKEWSKGSFKSLSLLTTTLSNPHLNKVLQFESSLCQNSRITFQPWMLSLQKVFKLIKFPSYPYFPPLFMLISYLISQNWLST